MDKTIVLLWMRVRLPWQRNIPCYYYHVTCHHFLSYTITRLLENLLKLNSFDHDIPGPEYVISCLFLVPDRQYCLVTATITTLHHIISILHVIAVTVDSRISTNLFNVSSFDIPCHVVGKTPIYVVNFWFLLEMLMAALWVKIFLLVD